MLAQTETSSDPWTGRSGAQANVIVFTEDNSILNPIGRLWMRVDYNTELSAMRNGPLRSMLHLQVH